MRISFGEKIRALREEFDLTQMQLAEQINMTQRKISYLENNKYEPSVEDMKIICLFFGISADFLLDLPEGLKRSLK